MKPASAGLTHYYIDAGAAGIADEVQTTQFEIRGSEFNLFETVLTLAIGEAEKRRFRILLLK